MQSSATNNSPYIDELTTSAGTLPQGFRKASLDPRRAGEIEENKSASIAEDSEDYTDSTEFLEGDAEFEFEKDERGADEFTSQDEFKDRRRDKEEQGRGNKRRQRRLGKIKRAANADLDGDLDEMQVHEILDSLDEVIINFTELVEAAPKDDFANWNQWFKKEKKEPPVPDRAKVLYIREEFNTKRSPHLWKSDPDRKWVLAFGNNKINNTVSNILYKYQNETISKDA